MKFQDFKLVLVAGTTPPVLGLGLIEFLFYSAPYNWCSKGCKVDIKV